MCDTENIWDVSDYKVLKCLKSHFWIEVIGVSFKVENLWHKLMNSFAVAEVKLW